MALQFVEAVQAKLEQGDAVVSWHDSMCCKSVVAWRLSLLRTVHGRHVCVCCSCQLLLGASLIFTSALALHCSSLATVTLRCQEQRSLCAAPSQEASSRSLRASKTAPAWTALT
jgi:hypothetical protein